MSQDWSPQGPPPPPPPPPPQAYNPYGYGGAPPPPLGGGGGTFPWEDRDRLGMVTALIETCKLVVTAPKDAFARLQPNGDLTSPLLFGLLLTWPVVVISSIFQVLLTGLTGGAEAAGFGLLQVGMIVVLYPVLFAIGIFISAGIYHLALTLIKGLDQSNFGFEGTLKAAAYCQVAALPSIVPFIGGLVTLALSIYLLVNAIQTVHRTSTQQAVIAVLAPVLICCVCGAIIFFMFGAALSAAMAGAGG